MPEEPLPKLPGETRPVSFDPERAISHDEALGVARRLARKSARKGKTPAVLTQTELPPDTEFTMTAWRLPARTVAFARARAEAEGTTMSEVLRDLLAGYAYNNMGSVAVWQDAQPETD